ncbi:hypothetical protein HpMS270_13070 [Helicobacter pylori]
MQKKPRKGIKEASKKSAEETEKGIKERAFKVIEDKEAFLKDLNTIDPSLITKDGEHLASSLNSNEPNPNIKK